MLVHQPTQLEQDLGFTLQSLSKDYDSHFVVKNINCDYIQSAQLEDELKIQSQFLKIKKASLQIEQNIFRENDMIFQSQVLLVNINSSGKPIKIPETLITLLHRND